MPPSKICDGVYVGNYGHAITERTLKRAGITHMVICLPRSEAYPPLRSAHWIHVEDSENPAEVAKMRDALPDTVDYIAEVVGAGGVVLVHCHMGISRSVTVAVAYMMRHHHMPFDAAMAHVRDKRPIANPNPRFQDILRQFL